MISKQGFYYSVWRWAGRARTGYLRATRALTIPPRALTIPPRALTMPPRALTMPPRALRSLARPIGMLSAGVLFLALAVSACSVGQQVRTDSDLSAESDMEVTLSDEMLAYLLDLSGPLGVEPGEVSPFDLERLAVLLDEEPGIELVDADTPENERLALSVTVEEIEDVLTEGPNRVEGLITVEETESDGDTERTLILELNKERVQQITTLSPVQEESAVDFLLPPEDMNEDEYVEYLAWAMEEYEQDQPIEDVIRDSAIELEVTVPGRLVSVEGGRSDGNTAIFSERVVRLLTVGDVTRWAVTWRE
ncbi:MAG: hypothetical protein ACLFM0_09570 [Spirochaetales bacterium]